MEQLVNSIGLLGGYFAILLLVAVAVESVLDVIKRMFGDALHLRATVSPDQLIKDVNEWIPEKGHIAVKAAALSNLLSAVNVKKSGFQVIGRHIKAEMAEMMKMANKSSRRAVPLDTADSIAGVIAEIRMQYDKNEADRVIKLRLISALIGVGIAVVLQIDSFQLLAPILPSGLLKQLNSAESLNGILQYGGMVLTGLGASAGSAFWHDQLDKVRALKETVRSMDDLRV